MSLINTMHEGAVVVITIDNPPLNALSAALLEELQAEIAGFLKRKLRAQ